MKFKRPLQNPQKQQLLLPRCQVLRILVFRDCLVTNNSNKFNIQQLNTALHQQGLFILKQENHVEGNLSPYEGT